MSTDKLTELTIRKVDGKPAPEFDTFIWGWGGDPYDPSYLLGLMTSDQIGVVVGCLLLEPRVRPAVRGAARRWSATTRRTSASEVIQEMIAILQEDLPVHRAHLRPGPRGVQHRRPRRRRAGVPGRDRDRLLPAGLLRAAGQPGAGVREHRIGDHHRPARRRGGDRRGVDCDRRVPASAAPAGGGRSSRWSWKHEGRRDERPLARRQDRRGAADAGRSCWSSTSSSSGRSATRRSSSFACRRRPTRRSRNCGPSTGSTSRSSASSPTTSATR